MKKRIYSGQQEEKKSVFIDFKNGVPIHKEQGRLVFGKPGAGKTFQSIKPDEYPVKNFE